MDKKRTLEGDIKKLIALITVQSYLTVQADMQRMLDNIDHARSTIRNFIYTLFGFILSIITIIILYWSQVDKISQILLSIILAGLIVLNLYEIYTYKRKKFDKNVEAVTKGAKEQLEFIEGVYSGKVEEIPKMDFEDFSKKTTDVQ